MFYAVRTQHHGGPRGDRFICPCEIYADSYIEAACKRFNLLSRESQEGTSGLLVTNWKNDAVIFDVERDFATGALVLVER